MDVLLGTVLALDAATYQGTVAVLRGGVAVAHRAVAMRGVSEERLMPAVVEAVDVAGADVKALSAVICGSGPGSFTSLRIAASIAKAICESRGIPLYACPSLALAAPADAGHYVVALDAQRGDVYALPITVEGSGQVVAGATYGVVAMNALDAAASDRGATPVVVGRGSATIRADAAARLLGALREAGSVDVASWEPAYGRKAEAQVRWEAAHGRSLTDA